MHQTIMPTLEDQGEKMLRNIDRLKELRRAQLTLLDELEEIAELYARGVDPRNLSRLGYDVREDKGKDKEARHRRYNHNHYGELRTPPVHTHAVMKDGSKIVFAVPMKVYPRRARI